MTFQIDFREKDTYKSLHDRMAIKQISEELIL